MDERFSRWYVLVGDCINLILSHYVHMYHKTGAGCEIHDTCCVRIMVILKLKLVKGNTEDEASSTKNVTAPDDDENHGTTVLK